MIGPVLGGYIANRAQDFAPALVLASAFVLAGGALMAALQLFDPLHPGSPASSMETRLAPHIDEMPRSCWSENSRFSCRGGRPPGDEDCCERLRS
jgi:hypothetical protein